MKRDPFAPGLLTRLPEPVHKVVLLRASRTGDFLCASPALRALRKALPGAEISMITLPILKDLVERSPYLDRFIPFPGYPGLAEQFFDARRTAQFFQEMQAQQFDLAIQMQGSGVNTNPFMLMLGAARTAGFIRPGDAPGCLDAVLPFPEEKHEIRRVLALTSFLGAPGQGEEMAFHLWPEDLAEARKILTNIAQPLIGLHPSARDLSRRWAPERFAAVGNSLQQRHGGTVIIIGDDEARDLETEVERELEVPYLNLKGKTSLIVLGGIIKHLSILITNDTGPAHIAYALMRPTVTIFGSSSPQLNGPIQPGPFRIITHKMPCHLCNGKSGQDGHLCLEHITAQQAIEAAEELLR